MMLGFLFGLVIGIIVGVSFSDAFMGIRKTFHQHGGDDRGSIAWQDALVICMAILVVAYGVGFWVVANIEQRQDTSIATITRCNQAGLLALADSLNERSQFTNALATRELEQDETLQKALVTLTDPEAAPGKQRQVLLDYLEVTETVNDLSLKAQSARIRHPLPTVDDLAECYKG